jgi:hypothetical protein
MTERRAHETVSFFDVGHVIAFQFVSERRRDSKLHHTRWLHELPIIMNDAEAYHKLYGMLLFCVPFYQKNFELTTLEPKQENETWK